MGRITYGNSVEKWGILEVICQGPSDKNPFIDYQLKAVFQGTNETVRAEGFYDGNGLYRVRFMPSFEGEYSFELTANFDLEIRKGRFKVYPAGENNHGPVRVANTWHFAYEDGTPYYSIGTTCYVWELQSDDLIEQTLKNLKKYSFNKIRFCIFPKHYDYNLGEPRSYPYAGKPMDSTLLNKENFGQYNGRAEGNEWDFKRFQSEHFQHIEKCILRLQELGVEADLIVMHPYDRWGFSCMSKEEDRLYWEYITARFSAYRNIWWSLANEYDLMREKNLKDWESYARILCDKDPYGHLRSIHNCIAFYDYSRPWVTHCSIQRQDLYKSSELVDEWRIRYKKPVVLDEIAYEGNIQYGWGNITGEEMLRRFWEAVCRGGYAGHGETYLHEEEILWWSHGGELHGESHKRFQFLYQTMKQTPGIGLKPYEQCSWDEVCAVPQDVTYRGQYYLYYYSFMRPSFRDFYFDEETEYEVRVLDTWNMTMEEKGIKKGRFRIELPGTQYIAVQILKHEI
ncbi:DUF5605 domain-containing protein [Clostridium sp. KNHs205]|uniref:DUF5605 domain-containing protein n=1 Tax=Clostridium sp. KNHs205 TaxID=1449050 RepID=UPI0009DE699B|nr:DUF5605 domain-containing protein [Clostridium sp. KNHs205]